MHTEYYLTTSLTAIYLEILYHRQNSIIDTQFRRACDEEVIRPLKIRLITLAFTTITGVAHDKFRNIGWSILRHGDEIRQANRWRIEDIFWRREDWTRVGIPQQIFRTGLIPINRKSLCVILYIRKSRKLALPCMT